MYSGASTSEDDSLGDDDLFDKKIKYFTIVTNDRSQNGDLKRNKKQVRFEGKPFYPDALEFLGEGTFNYVFKVVKRLGEHEGTEGMVVKIPKYITTNHIDDLEIDDTLSDMDDCARAVRVWNEVNTVLSKKAKLFLHGSWLAPFVLSHEQPTQEEICQCLIDIYRRTGRVVVDATVYGNKIWQNFIKDKDGNIICIDIANGIKLGAGKKRSPSIGSLNFWSDMKSKYNTFFSQESEKAKCIKIIQTIKTLLVLQAFLPDEESSDIINKAIKERKALTDIYDDVNKMNARYYKSRGKEHCLMKIRKLLLTNDETAEDRKLNSDMVQNSQLNNRIKFVN